MSWSDRLDRARYEVLAERGIAAPMAAPAPDAPVHPCIYAYLQAKFVRSHAWSRRKHAPGLARLVVKLVLASPSMLSHAG